MHQRVSLKMNLYSLLSVLLCSVAWGDGTSQEDGDTSAAQKFYPVSYENVYGRDLLGLNAAHRRAHCTVVDEASAEALRNEIADLGGAYELKQIDGHYVVVSTGNPPVGLVPHKNHLDVPISLTVKNVSIWEALKQFNFRLAEIPSIEAIPYIEISFGSQQPDAIWRLPSVTLDVQETAARQVLLRIFDQSSVPLAYIYEYRNGEIGGRPFPVAVISIALYNEWGDLCYFETDEGLLVPLDAIKGSYRGKPYERNTKPPAVNPYVEDQEANKAYYDEQERLMNLPPLPEE